MTVLTTMTILCIYTEKSPTCTIPLPWVLMKLAISSPMDSEQSFSTLVMVLWTWVNVWWLSFSKVRQWLEYCKENDVCTIKLLSLLFARRRWIYLRCMFQFWPSFFVDFAKVNVVNFALLGRQVKDILDNFLEKKLCPAPHVSGQLCQ